MNAHAAIHRRQKDQAASRAGGSGKPAPASKVGLPLFMQAAAPAAGATLQRQCDGANNPETHEECTSCANGTPLQAKLTIGSSDDPLEREADRVADRVLASPAHSAVGGTAPYIQRFAGQPDGETATAPASVDHALASSGRPLEPALRQDMEQRFGHDFSRVRVHTGTVAEQSARDVNANAYTAGNNVVFDAGRFEPGTHEGRRLLAHELTHVVQQSGADGDRVGQSDLKRGLSPIWVQRSPAVGEPCGSYEQNERTKSYTPEGILDLDVAGADYYGIKKADSVVIGDFGIDDGALKPSTEGELRSSWIGVFENSTYLLEFIGYTDCVGERGNNERLRKERAQAVALLFPASASRVTSVEGAPIREFLADNTSAHGRALNRSVVIRYTQQPSKPPPPPPPEFVTITLKEPDTESCSKAERDRLAVAFPVAEIMIRHAMSIIDDIQSGSEEHALLIKYFGKDAFSHRLDIKKGFRDTLRAWRGWDATYECQKQGTGECRKETSGHGPDYGYVEFRAFYGKSLWPHGNIHICEAAFDLDDEELAAAVLHETSHRLDWTDDEQYCGMKTNRGCSLDTIDAVDNADSYAQFAREAFHRWY